ncbi:hypothetical protein ZWY2020_027622 [Hordeum vulgare]|nr:hypothetical protein ZWY2020_027622 [Hordeum vulgare]
MLRRRRTARRQCSTSWTEREEGETKGEGGKGSNYLAEWREEAVARRLEESPMGGGSIHVQCRNQQAPGRCKIRYTVSSGAGEPSAVFYAAPPR